MKHLLVSCRKLMLLALIVCSVNLVLPLNVSAMARYTDDVTMKVGTKKTMKVPGRKNNTLDWVTYDKNIATVNSNGVVKAKAKGVASIWAVDRKYGEPYMIFSVTVKGKSSTKTKWYRITTRRKPKYGNKRYSKKMSLSNSKLVLKGKTETASKLKGSTILSKYKTFTFRFTKKTKFYGGTGMGYDRITKKQMFYAIRNQRKHDNSSDIWIAVKNKKVTKMYYIP